MDDDRDDEVSAVRRTRQHAVIGRRPGRRGQALVEFSLVLPIFVAIVVALFDVGRGIYVYNGVSQAAREIARVTSVHPGLVLGSSSRTQAVVATQQGLVPGLGTPTYVCSDLGSTVDNGRKPCQSGDFVRVRVAATYSPVLFLGLAGPFELSSESSLQIP